MSTKHTCPPCTCYGMSDEFGAYVTCVDDICRGRGECIHGDGTSVCEACAGGTDDCDACWEDRDREGES